MEEFEHLKIPLEDIKSATNNFDETKLIGSGGFWRVYKGELSHSKGRNMVAIRRLNDPSKQQVPEFWKEVMMLSLYRHENLISLLGICNEGGEKILVYEHASNGSLDHHLTSTTLTWMQRIKICCDAARGLSYLHFATDTRPRIVHRNIKSSNILLDENWNAKVSEFGLSKLLPLPQTHTLLVSAHVGTSWYCDPAYKNTGILTRASDVYSFGVLLFEVLCGRLCIESISGQDRFLVPTWKKSYELNKLPEIIFDSLKQQIDQKSLETYSRIAFMCLHNSPELRPLMSHVVADLEIALRYQEHYEEEKLKKDYKRMLMNPKETLHNRGTTLPKETLRNRGKTLPKETLLNKGKSKPYRKETLHNRGKTLPKETLLNRGITLTKGILLNMGKTWFSSNNGDNCEMISIAACLTSTANESQHYITSPEYSSRFAVGCEDGFGNQESSESRIWASGLFMFYLFYVYLVLGQKH